MMLPRLKLLRELLRDDGAIFVSIDDNEVHRLRCLMDEVFGEENFVANIVWQKRYVSNVTAGFLSDMHDHILCYGGAFQARHSSWSPSTSMACVRASSFGLKNCQPVSILTASRRCPPSSRDRSAT